MKIEQVISNLKRAKCVPYKKETLEMAIKALKQEPCEDCISRQAVLAPYESLNDNDTICIWLLRQNIKQQPPVTSQQKTGRWIPIKTRPMTEEEKEEYEIEYPYIYDCPLPDDGQDVFITTCRGNVTVDTFCRDYEGCYFETYCDDGDVVAWMPLPEPYKAESEDK